MAAEMRTFSSTSPTSRARAACIAFANTPSRSPELEEMLLFIATTPKTHSSPPMSTPSHGSRSSPAHAINFMASSLNYI